MVNHRKRKGDRRSEVNARIIPEDPYITIQELEQLIKEADTQRFFDSRKYWRYNFENHFARIFLSKQYICMRSKTKLVGFCSWVLTDKDNEHKINKTRWTLPEDISSGDILYLDVFLANRPLKLLKIKDFITKKYGSRIKEAFWFDMPHGKIFKAKLRGGRDDHQKLRLTSSPEDSVAQDNVNADPNPSGEGQRGQPILLQG